MHISLRAALVAVALSSSAAARGQSAPLTLDQAIARAVAASPRNTAVSARREVLSAARAQADTRPAASVDVLAENLGVGGPELNRQIQVGATYNMPIERGGKRAARIALVEGDRGVADAEAIVARLDLAEAVQRLFVEVQATTVVAMLADEQLGIARQLQREVQRRVDGARDPLFAGTRAQTQLAEAEVDLEIAEHARDAAMIRLTAMWRGKPIGLKVSAEDFLTFEDGEANAPSPADLAIYAARRRRADAAVALERSNARTDPTVSAGPRFIGTGDFAIVAGVSLPLRNRALNAASIARAQAEQRQIDADLAVERFDRERAIALAAEKVEESRHEAEAVRDRVIPGLVRTLAEVRAGYARGGFSFLDVSTAQTALAASRRRLIDAARRHHEAGVELDRLTGRFLPLVQEAR